MEGWFVDWFVGINWKRIDFRLVSFEIHECSTRPEVWVIETDGLAILDYNKIVNDKNIFCECIAVVFLVLWYFHRSEGNVYMCIDMWTLNLNACTYHN